MNDVLCMMWEHRKSNTDTFTTHSNHVQVYKNEIHLSQLNVGLRYMSLIKPIKAAFAYDTLSKLYRGMVVDMSQWR